MAVSLGLVACYMLVAPAASAWVEDFRAKVVALYSYKQLLGAQ